mmetsp:Transcript_21592/g.56303  ORF Transcript_21592/g.56303 Transcript_21592/m.56303 type:complete len:278 (+) Transcript_21592:395-1228(+)
MMRTPLAPTVLAALASPGVPISSTTTTCGFRFSTTDTMPSRRASLRSFCPAVYAGYFQAGSTDGWHSSPPPASSPAGSTRTTLFSTMLSGREVGTPEFCRSSSSGPGPSGRAALPARARSSVVLPTPGGPRSSTDPGPAKRSSSRSASRSLALPARMLSATTSPAGSLRVAEILCRVPSMPARSCRLKVMPWDLMSSTMLVICVRETVHSTSACDFPLFGSHQQTSTGRLIPRATSTKNPGSWSPVMWSTTAFLASSGSNDSSLSSSFDSRSSRAFD